MSIDNTQQTPTYYITLTEQQQETIRELTGKSGEVLALSADELESRILPALTLN